MEKIIELSREIGKKIQDEEAYIALRVAQQNCDDDKALQNLIGDFNLKRMAIGNESGKADKDDLKIQAINAEMRECYEKIMANENMKNYNNAKQEIDAITQRVVSIITQSAEGGDPNTVDYTPSCAGGDCSGCSGCG